MPLTLEPWATSQVVTAAEMTAGINDNFEAAFPDDLESIDWAPTLEATSSNPTIGTTTGQRSRVGPFEFLYARWTFTTAGSGFYFMTLPNASTGITASTSEGSGQTVGTWTLRDSSLPSSRNGSVLLRDADEIWFNLGAGQVSQTSPFAIASGDILSFNAIIPIA